MSYSIDVNILLYASDSESQLQSAAESFLNERKNSSELLYLTWLTLMSYQRITTNLVIFKNPLTPQQAWKNIEDLLALPQVRMIGEEEDFAHHYLQVTSEMHVRGNLVPDAHLAAILRQHGVSKIYSADSDFRKFKFLKVVNPFR
jgi:toxin-antitoxin system PIN domain toxin